MMTSQVLKGAQLFVGVVVIALVWCIALPRLAEQPMVEQRLDWLEAERIDPSVKFYTELERMEEFLERGK
jgi:hypothetical protein